MIKKFTSTIALVICFISLFCVVSCNPKSEPKESVVTRNPDRLGYEVCSYTIEPYEDCGTFLDQIFYRNDNYYMCMHYLNEEGLISSNVFITDTKGGNAKRVGIEDNLILNAMAGDKLLSLSAQNQITILDSSTGKIDRKIDCEELNNESVLCGFDDRFFLINSGKASCYDIEGKLLYSIEDDNLYDYNYDMGMFEQGEIIYIPISPSNPSEADFYQIDNKGLVKVSESRSSELICDEMSKNYYFGQDGEYVYDPAGGALTKIADFNSMNIVPESKAVMSPGGYKGIDDQHFVKFCTYIDKSVEVLLFNYDPDIDYSKATKITVGGYRINMDLGIRWMQYLFNKEDNGYRIVLEEYGDRFPTYDPDNPNNGINANLELLKYFKEGHQPDIYYGTFFDYDYMGRNGEVVDIMTLDSQGGESTLDDITPSILKATDNNGHLYRIFSSYCLDGFWGKTKWFGSNDMTIYDLKQKSDEAGVPLVNSYCSEDIVYGCINYPMAEFVYDADKPLTLEKVRDVVGFAVKYGVADSTQLTTISDVSDIQDDNYLIGYGGIGNLYNMGFSIKNEDISFLGYPSVYGTSHLVSPDGLVAISSDSAHIDECWKAVRLMLSDDIQKVLVLNQRIPVNDKILRESCKYAQDPKSVPADDPLYYSYYPKKDPVDSKSVDSFIAAIDSVDTVQTYDWGVWNIIYEEIQTYKTGKTADQVADSIYNRVMTYVKENY